ncbi:hypothetical protein PIB30_056813 [Stylosanthes scabra]|uniref:Uncharacterized protein n=1 Tax=Stylosanthes scabra TaxID=79078 RepID=A0ABU6TKS4_9FABA|nr:hypothetical protein [Stylosanthes scabra]
MAVESAVNNSVLKELVEPAITKPTARIPVITVVNPCRTGARIAVTDLTPFLPIQSYGGLAAKKMPNTGHTFDEVHPSKTNLQFCVYVIRLWEAPGRYNAKEIQSIEMVVEDCKAQRIHVSVPKGVHNKMEASSEGVQDVHDHKPYCH